MMTFNPEIEERIKESLKNADVKEGEDWYKHKLDQAKLYLLAIYYGLDTSLFISTLVRWVNILKICEKDFASNTIKWNIPLFLEEKEKERGVTITDVNWDWVDTEYRHLFREARKDAGGDRAGVISKMKKYFAENPHVRKDQVIRAAKEYISQTPDVRYLQRADYFIFKAIPGDGKSSRLSMYIENLKEEDDESNNQNNRYMGGLIT